MSDNLKNAGPQDRSRVNVHEEWEMAYWSRELGVTREKLVQLVQEVGPAVSAIRARLGIK